MPERNHRLDGRRSDPNRRQVESAILLSAIGIPVLLGIIGNGLGYPIATWIINLIADWIVWPYSFALPLLTTLTLLLSWRYPLSSVRAWRPIFVVAVTVTLPSFVLLVANWQYPTRYMKHMVWMATIELMQWLLVLIGVLMLFILVRRTIGVRLVAAEVSDSERAKPVSIAELLCWVTACAVLFAAVPWVVDQTPWSQVGLSYWYYPHMAIRILNTALPILLLVATRRWRWHLRILIAILIVFALQHVEPALYYIFYSPINQLANLTSLTSLLRAILTACGIALAIWLVEQRGYRFVRVGRKRHRSDKPYLSGNS